MLPSPERRLPDGMVLLKNEDNTLPLKNTNSVALFGNSSYDIIAGGTGSGDVHRKYTVSLIDGFANESVPTETQLATLYKTYIQTRKKAKAAQTFHDDRHESATTDQRDECVGQSVDGFSGACRYRCTLHRPQCG